MNGSYACAKLFILVARTAHVRRRCPYYILLYLCICSMSMFVNICDCRSTNDLVFKIRRIGDLTR